MPRWLKITGIGCGRLLGLFILLGVVSAIVGGCETATETNSQSEQTELEAAREEATQARREAEAAREEATRAQEQAAQAEEARTESETATEEAAPPEGEDEAPQERKPEDVLTLQYEHINSADYEAAYDLFTNQSKDRVSLEQYSTWFQEAGNYQITNFSFPTVQVEEDTATLIADVSVTSNTAGEEQYQATQEMELENGNWRIVMRDGQVETFAGVDAESSPQEDNATDSSSGVVVRVTGDPGIQFQGNIANLDSSRTVEGTTPAEFPVEVDQGFLSGDSVSANAQNMGGAGNLTVQIVSDGEVVKESSTSAEYGIAQVNWVPGE